MHLLLCLLTFFLSFILPSITDVQPEYFEIIEPLRPRVGDLTDPLYLDFISYSQFYVAALELEKSRKLDKRFEFEDDLYQTFEEQLGNSILRRLGKREEEVAAADDQKMPPQFDSSLLPTLADPQSSEPEAGGESATATPQIDSITVAVDKILAGASVDLDLDSSSPQFVAAKVQAWLDYLVAKGYALGAKAEILSNGTRDNETTMKLGVTFVGSATLWGTEAILTDSTSKTALPLGTSFDAYATKALLLSLGFRSNCTLSTLNSKNTFQEWTIKLDKA